MATSQSASDPNERAQRTNASGRAALGTRWEGAVPIHLGLILLLAATGCREEHPFHDSTSWDMDRSIDRLATIVERQNDLLEQLHAATPIPPSIAMEL